MEMTNEWAGQLKKDNIWFEDFPDKIIFYDPEEKTGCVIVREHLKFKKDLQGYSSTRIDEISYKQFKEKFPDAIIKRDIPKTQKG